MGLAGRCLEEKGAGGIVGFDLKIVSIGGIALSQPFQMVGLISVFT